jgi:ABC-type lipoprotein release transport system permease subunit
MTLVSEAARSIGVYPGSAEVIGPQHPAEIVNSNEVGRVPALLAAVLGGAAALSLAMALSASVRRRRRELAILQALGFSRRQLATTITWQATGTIAAGLAIGVPLGIVVGRNLWNVFAQQLDVVAHPTVPVALLVIVIGVSFAVANVVAALPARTARHMRSISLLHTE